MQKKGIDRGKTSLTVSLRFVKKKKISMTVIAT